jgi:hypothetical protein
MEITVKKGKVITAKPQSLSDKLRKKLVVHRVKKEKTQSQKDDQHKKWLASELKSLQKKFKELAQKEIDQGDDFLDFPLWSCYLDIDEQHPTHANSPHYVISFKTDYVYQKFVEWLTKEGFTFDNPRHHYHYDPDGSDYSYSMRIYW